MTAPLFLLAQIPRDIERTLTVSVSTITDADIPRVAAALDVVLPRLGIVQDLGDVGDDVSIPTTESPADALDDLRRLCAHHAIEIREVTPGSDPVADLLHRVDVAVYSDGVPWTWVQLAALLAELRVDLLHDECPAETLYLALRRWRPSWTIESPASGGSAYGVTIRIDLVGVPAGGAS